MPLHKADTLFENGRVWAGRGRPPADALAVAGGRVLAVGEPHELDAVAGPATRRIDLAGATLVPGFIDAHAHLWKIGHLLTTLLDLRRVDGVASLREMLRARAATLPEGGWLYGRGYNEARFAEGRGPTRGDLDAIVRDRPVVLMRTCAHIIACNSAALERAGIGGDTPAPAGGEIDRDERGVPTGVLRETAMGLVLGKMPAPTADDYAAMLTAALRHQASQGITSTTDAGVAPELLQVYRDMDAAGTLAGRVNVMALETVDGVGAVPLPAAPFVSDHLRVDTVKFFADGGLSGATAALSVPYRHAGTRGVLRLTSDQLYERARAPHAAGWRIATHAIGDEAIEHVLTAYERLGAGPVRHRIEHFGLPTPQQLARAASLGVIAAPQAIFIRELGLNFRRYLPDDLLARAYPVRAMIDAGITVALSSDAPVVENDAPLAGMQAAVARHDERGEVLAADECITAEQALDAYTRGGAIACGADAHCGTLTPGCWADLAVLSASPLDVAPDAIGQLRVLQTWIGGRLVYEA
jgi:hypothetical protein